MKTGLCSGFLLSFLILLSVNFAQAVTVTSLNIEWYGRGGVIGGTAENEYRDKTIKDFVKNLPETDVFVFQEITNPEMLMSLFSNLTCFTYTSKLESHQYVVMCSKKGLLEEMEINRDVQLNRFGLRAALIGTFKLKSGESFNVIGLHLKAGRQSTDVRLKQIEALKPDLIGDEPTLIIGDVNTYLKERTSLVKSDNELMSDILSVDNFVEIQNLDQTYLGFRGNIFDRAWSRGLLNTQAAVYGPCDEDFVQVPYANRGFYERFVSDHCALQVQFELGL